MADSCKKICGKPKECNRNGRRKLGMIKVSNVTQRFEENGNELVALKSLDLEISEGSFFGIVGRSGSGKSTLLKTLGGLLPPSEGKVLIGGTDIYALKAEEQADFRSSRIGFVFQDYFLEETFTVYQNVEIVLMIAGVPQKERRARIEEALKTVEMLDRQKAIVKNLSGGEKQRVSIARAIVNDAGLIFADEPCGNLDWENGQKVMKYLRRLCERNKTVVLVTHNPEDAKQTDEMIELRDGKVIRHENFR